MIPTLETNRLVLRAFTEADATRVQKLAGAFEIADTTLAIPHPYEDGLAKPWISQHEALFASGRTLTLAIIRKDGNNLMGAISLMSMAPGHQAELGYWIGVPYWGNGYCTEAARRVVAYAFTELALERIHAAVLSRNPASSTILEKVGFISEGVRRSHVEKWNKLEDLKVYGLLRREWEVAVPE